eukprot:TRINITY_DN825_c0_g1_i7.p1 TRINITY_DN825_c0_g1~~TRINITY_DN825_c0_g1_i7.p1  ORF type:complete len:1685 (+),score=317.98 TRINITY_DN825_c0_g1_i7:45-5057(+)
MAFPRLAVFLALCGASHAQRELYPNECPSGALGSFLDMSSWVQAGTEGRWEVMDGGRTIKQYVNTPDPGFYLSDRDDYIDFVLKGTISVESQTNSDGSTIGNDDDMVGMMVGMHGPLPEDRFSYEGMFFSWGGGGSGTSRFKMIQKLNGTIPPDRTGGHSGGWEGACFWHRTHGFPLQRINNPNTNPEGEGTPHYGNRNGLREGIGCYDIDASGAGGAWQMDRIYSFQLLFTENEMKVSIDGNIAVQTTQADTVASCLSPDRPLPAAQFDCLPQAEKDSGMFTEATTQNCQIQPNTGKAWRPGRLAWMNLSQHGVRYGNIRMFSLQSLSAGATAPQSNEDIYGVIRAPGGDTFEKVENEFHSGVLANDWSPSLKGLQARVPSVFGQDPQVDGVAPARAICLHGSAILVGVDGGFSFEPIQTMIAAVDNGDFQTEVCQYRAQDSDGQWGPLTNMTFALQPRSMVGLTFDIHWEPLDHNLDWYFNLVDGSNFGELVANGSCIRITDWQMTNSANGKFRLDGQNVVANRPDELTVGFKTRQHYIITVTAISIFGLVQSKDIIIEIPAQCELTGACVCTNSGLECDCTAGFVGENCTECADNRLPIDRNANCTLCVECPLAAGTGFPAAASNGSVTGKCLYPEGQCSVFCHRSTTCSGHGECVDNALAPGTCDCDEGWAGDACDQCDTDYYTDECIHCHPEETCGGAGTCDTTTGECICADRWGGPGCQYCKDPWYFPPACDLSCTRDQNCSSNGECVQDHLNFAHHCECDAGWSGEWTIDGCNVTCSRENDCSGHGECQLIGQTGDFTCQCDRGLPTPGMWDGDSCDECVEHYYPESTCDKYCNEATTCHGRGTCDPAGNCDCDAGSRAEGFWQGERCAECQDGWYPPFQCNVPCSRDGNCSSHGDCSDVGYCKCDPGFTGVACDRCFPGYFPPNACNQFCDAAISCSNHGDCNAIGGCTCHENWFGDDCSKFCNGKLTCNNNGMCDPNGKCICDANFVQEDGTLCLECVGGWYPYKLCDTECHNQDCGHGVCSATDGRCLCDWGWSGDNCTIEQVEEPVTPSPPTPEPSTPEPTDQFGAALEDVDECPVIDYEIAGICALWLMLAALLLLLLSCSLMLLMYFLKKKKKPVKRKRPAKVPPATGPAKVDVPADKEQLLVNESQIAQPSAPLLAGSSATLAMPAGKSDPSLKLGPGNTAGQEGLPELALNGSSAPTMANPAAKSDPGFKLGPGNTGGQEGLPELALTGGSAPMLSNPAAPASEPGFKLGPGNTGGQEGLPELALNGSPASTLVNPLAKNEPGFKLGPGNTAGQEGLPASRQPSGASLLSGTQAAPLRMSSGKIDPPAPRRVSPSLLGSEAPQMSVSPVRPNGPSGFGPAGNQPGLLGGASPLTGQEGSPLAQGAAPTLSGLQAAPLAAGSSPGGASGFGPVGGAAQGPAKVQFGQQNGLLDTDLLGGTTDGGSTNRPAQQGSGASGLFATPGASAASGLLGSSTSLGPQGPAKVQFGKQDGLLDPDLLGGTLDGRSASGPGGSGASGLFGTPDASAASGLLGSSTSLGPQGPAKVQFGKQDDVLAERRRGPPRGRARRPQWGQRFRPADGRPWHTRRCETARGERLWAAGPSGERPLRIRSAGEGPDARGRGGSGCGARGGAGGGGHAPGVRGDAGTEEGAGVA